MFLPQGLCTSCCLSLECSSLNFTGWLVSALENNSYLSSARWLPSPNPVSSSFPLFFHEPCSHWNWSSHVSVVKCVNSKTAWTILILPVPVTPGPGVWLDYGGYLVRPHCDQCSLTLSWLGTCPLGRWQPPPTGSPALSPLSQRESCGSVRRLGRWPRLRKMVKSRPMRSAATPEYSSCPADRARAAQSISGSWVALWLSWSQAMGTPGALGCWDLRGSRISKGH